MKTQALSFILFCLAVTAASATEVTYSQQIKPLVAARCVACHGADAPEYPAFKKEKDAWLAKGIGPRMDSYAHLIYYTGWPDTGALMRRLDDGAGKDDKKPGNMYQHLGDNEAERQANLALFKGWVGNWSHKKFDALTKDDLAGIKVLY
ncbi:MAG: cytochrome C [Desulfuromonadales bacterium]|nr:cytochrome C [Desulfuromonadales bacterium]